MRKAFRIVLTALFVVLSAVVTFPQSGGAFVIQKSVIAGGGEQSIGGTFIVTGTVGEAVAGTTSTGGTFELGGGFWGGGTIAAAYTVSGRVFTSTGDTLRNVVVSITNNRNNAVQLTTSVTGGIYQFTNIAGGDTYTIAVSSKRYRFSIQTVFVSNNLTNQDFVGIN